MNIRNAESAWLKAGARRKEWQRKFMAKWTAPVQDEIILRWWETLPPERKAALKAADPKKYAEAERVVKALQPRGSEKGVNYATRT